MVMYVKLRFHYILRIVVSKFLSVKISPIFERVRTLLKSRAVGSATTQTSGHSCQLINPLPVC